VVNSISGSNRDAFKAGAIIEGKRADARHTIRNRDRSKAGATREGIRADARHAIRDGDRSKAVALNEGIRADARNAISDGNRSKAVAIIEGIIANARHAIFNYDFCNRFSPRCRRRACIIPHLAIAGDGEDSAVQGPSAIAGGTAGSGGYGGIQSTRHQNHGKGNDTHHAKQQ